MNVSRGSSSTALALVGILCLLFVGKVLAQNTVTYIYTDAQGTPLAEADAQGNITATYDYKPYGTQVLGSSPRGPGYTGHVNDADTGLVYMEARYYEPDVGRFLSTDPSPPVAGNIFNFSRSSYANNNPVTNIDPDGRVVTSLNASNNQSLQKYINTNSSGQFRFNGANQLVKADAPANGGGSTYYSDKINAAINSPVNVILDVAPTATQQNGNVVEVDSSAGGGITEPRSNGDVNVTISGNANTSLKNMDGGSLVDGPADILMHEIVGHAVPIAVGPDTGNAVTNENKARSQIAGADQRAPEPDHVEGKSAAVTSCGLLCSR
jgi:RHS repeat-associated protein